MNYQSTFSLSPTVGATGTWEFEASLLPHPIDFMYINKKDSIYPVGFESNFMNQQVDGATHFDKYLSFIGMVQRWRLAYMSVTCYQDGPDLANQGSIVVCQNPVMAQEFSMCANSTPPGSMVSIFPKFHAYSIEDHPNFTTAQGMPNAYFGRSREGAYVPLKLTETCQDWVSDADRVGASSVAQALPNESIYDCTGSNLPVFPHVNIHPTGYVVGGYMAGQGTSPMLNATWAHISTRNLAITTSFTFFVRCGIEMQVSPSSVLSPQLKLSPPYDPVALTSYFQIARELKDGYPSEYNDLGKMWDTISKAAKKILPIFHDIPIIGAPAKMVSGIVGAGDVIRARRAAGLGAVKGGAPKAKRKRTAPRKKPQPKKKSSKGG